MALEPGTRLGPYEVSSALGAGGMGEVWRARDPRLSRDVAIKVLPEVFFESEERRARFEREARTLASLNHPGIAAIYSFEEVPSSSSSSSTRHVLVMELVEGEDLAQRLARGALPPEEAVAIARQIAEALEAAHEKGIVHRDLKPANVKVTRDGAVKLLDFGLARAIADDEASSSSAPSLTQSPTASRHLTEAGVLLGTAPYMSPEQARGKPVDKRTDVWSFGVVLHEMLTGRRLFAGETAGDTLAAVLRQDVDLSSLPQDTPPHVKRLLARCLVRDPKLRLRDVGEARIALASDGDPGAERPPAAARPAGARTSWLVAALACAAAAVLAWTLKPAPPVPRHPRVKATYPLSQQLGRVVPRRFLALSPDGRTLATVVGSLGGGSALEVRRLDELEATRIPGSDGVRSVFFSPDGRFVGFGTETALRKVEVGSSDVLPIADIGTTLSSGPNGISWADDGFVYYAALDGIRAVPAAGGASKLVVSGRSLAHPRVAPGSRWLLYAHQSATVFQPEGTVVLRSLADGSEAVLTTGTSPILAGDDLLLVARAGGVFAAPLSLSSRRLVREPVLALAGVALSGSAAQYDLSRDGTLVYLGGAALNEPPCLPVRVKAGGVAAPLSKTVHEYSDPRVSPDGSRLAVHLQDEGNDVWAFEVARDALTRLTFDPGEDETPVFSPDGRWVAFSATRGDKRVVIRRPADGSGAEEVLWTPPDHAHVTDWSPDGKSLLVDVYRPSSHTDIVRLELAEKPTPRPFLETPFDESSGRVSPDGRWIAYRSNETGRDEIYVQPFPGGGGKVAISSGGGSQPVWARDGRALYFRGDADLMEARLGAAPAPAFQAPVPLFKDRFARPQGVGHTTYDVFPDGSFLFLETVSREDTSGASRNVVATFHWLENLDLGSAARR